MKSPDSFRNFPQPNIEKSERGAENTKNFSTKVDREKGIAALIKEAFGDKIATRVDVKRLRVDTSGPEIITHKLERRLEDEGYEAAATRLINQGYNLAGSVELICFLGQHRAEKFDGSEKIERLLSLNNDIWETFTSGDTRYFFASSFVSFGDTDPHALKLETRETIFMDGDYFLVSPKKSKI